MRGALPLLFVLAAAAPAAASNDSIVSFGIGTALGVRHHTDEDGTIRALATELAARLRVLHALGAELAYVPTAPADDDERMRFDSPFRFSGLLYILPIYPVGLYLKAGVGGASIGSLFTINAEAATYHGGGGLDVTLGDHFVLGGELLWLVPGMHTVVTEVVNASVAASNGTTDEDTRDSDHLFSAGNFRAALHLRYCF